MEMVIVSLLAVLAVLAMVAMAARAAMTARAEMIRMTVEMATAMAAMRAAEEDIAALGTLTEQILAKARAGRTAEQIMGPPATTAPTIQAAKAEMAATEESDGAH